MSVMPEWFQEQEQEEREEREAERRANLDEWRRIAKMLRDLEYIKVPVKGECFQRIGQRHPHRTGGGKAMNLYEIVMKLVGPVCPTGDHNTDQERLKNMKALTELVDRLLFDIGEADQYAEAPDASMKAIGVHARDFLKGTKEAIYD